MCRRFEVDDESLSDTSHSVKDFDYWSICYAGDFLKAYEGRKIELRISEVLFGDNIHSHFIFRAIPNQGWDSTVMSAVLMNSEASNNESRFSKEPMLICLTGLVESPKGVISSKVWFARTDQLPNFFRQESKLSIYRPIEVSLVGRKWEINIPGIHPANYISNSENRLVQGGAKIVKGIGCGGFERGRELLSQSKFKAIVQSISMRLSDKSIWSSIKPSINSFMQVIGVLPAPCNAAPSRLE